MTNAEAVHQIISRVAEVAEKQGLLALKVTTETDGTTTFQHETVTVHVFESGRELLVRGPDSGRATKIDAGGDLPGQFNPDSVNDGAERIVTLLRTRFEAA